MPFDMGIMLTNDEHLKPLLHYYLGLLNPALATKRELDEEDWEYIPMPNGQVASYRLDVVAGGRSGSLNIRDAYLNALAHCLKNGTTPSTIQIVSIINHSQAHWTCSVTEIQIEPDFIANLKTKLVGEDIESMPVFRIVNLLNKSLHPTQTPQQIENDLTLFGTRQLTISHYDSHNPDPERFVGSYYQNYRKTLDGLVAANRDKTIHIKPKKCKGQKGNTCGDNSLWNGFMAGVLGFKPKEEFVQVDSEALRAFSEQQLPKLPSHESHEDTAFAKQVDEHIKENIKLARAMYTPSAPVLTTQPAPPKPVEPNKEPPQIFYFAETSKKNKNVEKLLEHFGHGIKDIKTNIQHEFSHKKTERGIKGFFQRLNTKIGRVATKRRQHQMDHLATIISKLQKDKALNNNEKGIILQGLLKDIIDEITLNEPKNIFNSRMVAMCKNLSNQLNQMDVSAVRTHQAKNLCKIYDHDGLEAFRSAAAEYIVKSPKKLGKRH